MKNFNEKFVNSNEIRYLRPVTWRYPTATPDFLQHFVRREMTMIHLETTSPPEVVSSREILARIYSTNSHQEYF
jgi:hypothetical protein